MARLLFLFLTVTSMVYAEWPADLPKPAPNSGNDFFEKNPALWRAKLATDQAAKTAQVMNGWPRQTNHTFHNKGPCIFDELGRSVMTVNDKGQAYNPMTRSYR